RTRRLVVFIGSCVGEPLKRSVRRSLSVGISEDSEMVRVHGCVLFAIILVYLSIPKGLGNSKTSNHNSDIAREILLKQPDFVAIETVSSAHSGHGFSIAFEK